MITDKSFDELLSLIENPKLQFDRTYANLEQYLNQTYNEEFATLIKHHPFSHALENALSHGSFPVKIKIYRGNRGNLFLIADSGRGFDFIEVQRKFNTGKPYFIRYGQGFKSYNLTEDFISFEQEGRQINIVNTFPPKDLKSK